jgi:hypothetical protein
VSCSRHQQAHALRVAHCWHWGARTVRRVVEELERAQAQAVAAITMYLVNATEKDWRACAWWLERRCPEIYGAKQTMRVEKAPANMTDAELEAAREARLRARGGARARRLARARDPNKRGRQCRAARARMSSRAERA